MKTNDKIEKCLETLSQCFGGKFLLIETKDYDRPLNNIKETKYMVTMKYTNLFEIPGKYGQYFLSFNTLKEFYDYVDNLEELKNASKWFYKKSNK